MRLNFQHYNIDEYRQFLAAKRIPEFSVSLDAGGLADGLEFPDRFAHLANVHVDAIARHEWLPMPSFMFDDQDAVTTMALEAERFAVWMDCGLGKTLIELEWARQVAMATGGKVLIITVNEVVEQCLDEAGKFYGDTLEIDRIETREGLRHWCVNDDPEGARIGITNYEKMNPDERGQVVTEMRSLAGVVLDESSRLKAGGGKQKWALIKSCKGIRFKLSCTATPAPNDVMEFASQASWLERMRSENEIIWTYFTRNPKTNEWEVKAHAKPHFFRWMASWSIYVANPKTFGWRLDQPDVPQPQHHWHNAPPTEAQIRMLHAAGSAAHGTGDLFGDKRLGMVSQTQLLEAARGFIYRTDADGKKSVEKVESNKPWMVAQLARRARVDKHQVLIWVQFDAEAEIIADYLRETGISGFEVLSGAVPKKKRGPILQAFKHGQLPILIGKAKMLGFGLNFQNCTCMIFSGFNDSFEEHYQAVRRAYRYGQTESVQIHMVQVEPLEGPVLRNLMDKAAQFQELIHEQEQAYLGALKTLRPQLAAGQC